LPALLPWSLPSLQSDEPNGLPPPPPPRAMSLNAIADDKKTKINLIRCDAAADGTKKVQSDIKIVGVGVPACRVWVQAWRACACA
jgi:hypothetical protein